MTHHDAVELLGRCPCLCHHRDRHRSAEPCWCRDGRGDPLEISHNDRIHAFSRCDCRHGGCPRTTTAPEMRRAIERLLDRRRERRIAQGRPTSSDWSYIARNIGRYPMYWRHGRTG